ncbi:MAG: hypothetical protein BYD32DRAFT_461969 [Podila humilis]|nr:MAG: hypothetical protein BYD32DRAFT_461969 [Podila humilis]
MSLTLMLIIKNVSSHARGHNSDRDDDGGDIYIPPSNSRRGTDLDTMMQSLIDDEMATIYHPQNTRTNDFSDPDPPHLARPLLQHSCLQHSFADHGVDIQTIHTAENALKMEAGAEPLDAGVEFKASAGYGFSADSRTLACLSYTFHLQRPPNEVGHQEVVILKNGTPCGFVGFVHRKEENL